MTPSSRWLRWPVTILAVAIVVLPAVLSTLALLVAPGSGAGTGLAGSLVTSTLAQLALALPVIAMEAVIGVALAVVLPRRGRLSTVTLALLLIPPLLPPFVVALLAVEIAEVLPRLVALALVEFWHWTPLFAALALLALRRVPDRARLAADIDGLGRWEFFREVEFAALRPVLVLALALRLAGFLGLTAEAAGLAGRGGGGPLVGMPAALLLGSGSTAGAASIVTVVYGLIALVIGLVIASRSELLRPREAPP